MRYKDFYQHLFENNEYSEIESEYLIAVKNWDLEKIKKIISKFEDIPSWKKVSKDDYSFGDDYGLVSRLAAYDNSYSNKDEWTAIYNKIPIDVFSTLKRAKQEVEFAHFVKTDKSREIIPLSKRFNKSSNDIL